MELQERLKIIESLMIHLNTYRGGQRVNFGPEEKLMMQDVYFDIYQQRINTGCVSCIINGLEFLQAYYQRESAKIPVQEETTSTEITVLDIKKPCKKCGKNKSK